MLSTDRSRKYRAKQATKGLVRCRLLIPAAADADLHQLAEALRRNPEMEVPLLLRDPLTKRLKSIRKLKP